MDISASLDMPDAGIVQDELSDLDDDFTLAMMVADNILTLGEGQDDGSS